MTLATGPHSVTVTVYLTDMTELRESLGGDVTPERLKAVLIAPFDVGDIGATLTDVQVADAGTDAGRRAGEMPIQTWTITADITDAALFERLIAERYARMWHDDEWSPANAEEAIYEAFLASNETASPADYGYEIAGWAPAPAADTPAMEI